MWGWVHTGKARVRECEHLELLARCWTLRCGTQALLASLVPYRRDEGVDRVMSPAQRARPRVLRACNEFYASSAPKADELGGDARLFRIERDLPKTHEYPRVGPRCCWLGIRD